MVHLGSLLSTQEARVALGCRVASCDHATLSGLLASGGYLPSREAAR